MDQRMVPPRPKGQGPRILPGKGIEDQGEPSQIPLPPSPFIKGTSIRYAWDATCLEDMMKCPRYYQLKRVEGWERGSNIHLRWGQELHKTLEDYDRGLANGLNHDKSLHASIRALLDRCRDWEPDPRTKSEELKTIPKLFEAVVWYTEKYNPDPAKTFILNNGKPAVELNFAFEVEEGFGVPMTLHPYLFCGYLDRVVDFSDSLFVMDRKTTTSTPGSYYFDQFDLSTQMSLYSLAGRVIMKSPVKGVIIDSIQVAVGFCRATRSFTYRTNDQLEEWITTAKYWIKQAEACAINDYWPMNTSSCDKYGGCEFKGICSKSPSVRHKFLANDFKKGEIWNPLKPR